MCASVCPSEALWYGTVEEFDDTRRGSLLRDFLFGRQEVRTKVLHRRRRPRRRPARRARRGTDAPGSTTRSASDGGVRVSTERRQSPAWKRDFPYEAAAEDEVTRREFARYLVARRRRDGRRQRRPRRVDPAAHRSTPASPEPIVALADVAVGGTYLFRYPDRRRPGRSSLRLGDREVVAFSQKCTHLGCVVYYEADEDRWHCPCHEGNFDARTGAVHLRPADPTRSAASTSRSATTA